MKKKKVNIYPLHKLITLQDCQFSRFVNLAMTKRLSALKHLPDTADLINKTWKNFVILLCLVKRFPLLLNKTIFMLEFLAKSKWTTFLDKLNSSSLVDLNTLHIQLFQILLVELTLTEKDYKPYWTPAFKKLSEKLLSPIEIGSVDLDSTLHDSLSPNVEVKSPFLTITQTNLANKNLQNTSCPLSISTVADKWEDAATPNQLKALTVRLKLSRPQSKIIDDWINTSRYVYNKAVHYIHAGHEINHFKLRDTLVTNNTKKLHAEYNIITNKIKTLTLEKRQLDAELASSNDNDVQTIIKDKINTIKLDIINSRQLIKNIASSKNSIILDWELNTPTCVRDGAVNDVCKAYKTGFANLKRGNINHFRLNYKRRTNPNKCVVIPKSIVKNVNGVIHISKQFLGENNKFKMGKRTINKYKDVVINNDTRIIKRQNKYWILIPIPINDNPDTISTIDKADLKYCGIDPGIRTFMTSFTSKGVVEYIHRDELLDKLKAKLVKLKTQTKRIAKKSLNKINSKIDNLINELHWKTITHILDNNDIIAYGNIKSHDIVKGKKNKYINTRTNALKFYTFRRRLIFKALERRKILLIVAEGYTTKTCSFCGSTYSIGSSKIYDCKKCNKRIDRDINSAKNILMKGILLNGI